MNRRAIYWSVRRELWENRSIYIAPLAVAAVMVFGFFIAAIARLSTNTVKLHSLDYPRITRWLLLMPAPITRPPFLWAVLPLAAIRIVEKVVFNTSRFGAMLGSRISGDAKDEAMRSGVLMLGHFKLGEFLSC